jgi:hypothetical protein
MWDWNYSSTFLDFGTRWKWVVSFMPRPLYPRGRSPRYQLDRRLGGLQSRFGPCAREKNLATAGNKTPTVQPLALPITTELSRLQRYLYSNKIYIFFYINKNVNVRLYRFLYLRKFFTDCIEILTQRCIRIRACFHIPILYRCDLDCL